MRRMLLMGAVLLVSGTTGLAQTPERQFVRDAGDVFGLFVGQAGINFLLGKEGIQKFAESEGLSKTWEGSAIGWAAQWEGGNASGRITVYGSFPDMMDRTRNLYWARFEPPVETPMPEALLSHLLAKASQTRISGGDLLEIKLPADADRAMGQSVALYSLTLRLTTGALVSNYVRISVPTK